MYCAISALSDMLTKRIIACLDVDGGRVVKGVQFVNLRDAGDPAELAKAHSEAGADEIVLLDISAAHQNRTTLLDTVRRTARQLFIPFTVLPLAEAFARWKTRRRSSQRARTKSASTPRRLPIPV